MTSEGKVIDHRLQLVRNHWNRRPQALQGQAPRQPAHPELAIAISREAGAPGREVADEIGRLLQWPVYDQEILDLIARQAGLRAELLHSVDERDPNWLVELFGSIGGGIHSASFAHHLIRVLSALAAHGQCVIVGRGAAVLLPHDTALRVRIVAGLRDRIERAASLNNLSKSDAADHVKRVERERNDFVMNHFHRDVNDQHSFDLVINASHFTVPQCADLIVHAVRGMAEGARSPD